MRETGGAGPVLDANQLPGLSARRGEPAGLETEIPTRAPRYVPFAGVDQRGGRDSRPEEGAEIAEMLAVLEEFVDGSPARSTRGARLLATVLFTDIVDSTERVAALGDGAWSLILDRHDAIATSAVHRRGGRLVKSTGDGVLATFPCPSQAIDCARALRAELSHAGIPIRAGVHTGEVELRGDDLSGIGVHIAARVAALARPGELLVSRTVRDLVAGAGYQFSSRGAHALKGLPDAWELLALV
jgi:class 3 adenylate cyclase